MGGHPIQAASSDGPVGMWLIQAPYFDPYVEAGVVMPMYPLLVLNEDGRFALFAVSTYCFDHPADDVDFSGSPMAEWALCDRMRHSAYFPSPQHLFARPAASGRWAVEAGRMQLDVDSEAEALFSFALERNRRLSEPRDYVTAAEQLNAARQMGPSFTPASAKHFYGDFFILGGGALEMTLDADTLTLKKADSGAEVGFERIAPEALNQASAVLRALEMPSVYFFRCALPNTRDPVRSRIPGDELSTLVALAAQVSTDMAKARHANALSADGQDAEALRVWPQDERERAAARVKQQMMSLPVISAARSGHLGAYFGCPDQDAAIGE